MFTLLRDLTTKSTQSTGAKALFTGYNSPSRTRSGIRTDHLGINQPANTEKVLVWQPTDEAELISRARDLVKKPTKELLRRLTVEFGMSWSDIASAVGISVQNIRKWRLGSSISTENQMALAKVVAALDILGEAIEDPASWLELPILDGYSPSNLDLLSGKQYGHLFDLAYSYCEPKEILYTINPNWEIEFRLEHEVFIAEDGLPAIRRRKSRGET